MASWLALVLRGLDSQAYTVQSNANKLKDLKTERIGKTSAHITN